jgi:hypothetical protein
MQERFLRFTASDLRKAVSRFLQNFDGLCRVEKQFNKVLKGTQRIFSPAEQSHLAQREDRPAPEIC